MWTPYWTHKKLDLPTLRSPTLCSGLRMISSDIVILRASSVRLGRCRSLAPSLQWPALTFDPMWTPYSPPCKFFSRLCVQNVVIIPTRPPLHRPSFITVHRQELGLNSCPPSRPRWFCEFQGSRKVGFFRIRPKEANWIHFARDEWVFVGGELGWVHRSSRL